MMSARQPAQELEFPVSDCTTIRNGSDTDKIKLCDNLLTVIKSQTDTNRKVAHLEEKYDNLEEKIHILQEDVRNIRVIETRLEYIVKEIDQLKQCVKSINESVTSIALQQQKFVSDHNGDTTKIILWVCGTLLTLTGLVIGIIKM